MPWNQAFLYPKSLFFWSFVSQAVLSSLSLEAHADRCMIARMIHDIAIQLVSNNAALVQQSEFMSRLCRERRVSTTA